MVKCKNNTEQAFFEELAKYYKDENDISNVTVALCNSSKYFRAKFLNFFFPLGDFSDETIISIEREVRDTNGEGSRVDIYIRMASEEPYIIEVKKYDANHHFGQYERAYEVDKNRFGYITNYICYEGLSRGYDVKTWENLYDEISSDVNTDSLTRGYLKYLERVCNINRYTTKMNLRNLSSIPQLFNTIDTIVKNLDGLTVDNDQRGTVRYAYKKFLINRSSENGKVYGEWLLNAYTLLEFNSETPISIGVGGGNEIDLKKIEKEEANNKFNNFSAPKIDQKEWWGYLWFTLSKEKMNEFYNSDSVKIQEQILADFVREVVAVIRKYENL